MYTAFHNHSYFSVLDAYSSPKELLERAKQIGLKGFQISDHGNEYGFPYFDKLKKDYPEIKLIYGVEMYECQDINIRDTNSRYWHLLLTCINEESRKALNELVTISNFTGFYYRPRIDLKTLQHYGHLFVASSACLASKLSREQDYSRCIDYVYEYKNIFKQFYLEIMPHNTEDQIIYNEKLMRLAGDTGTEIIITNDAHSATKEDLPYQGRLVQIARDDETASEAYIDCYLKNENEIHEQLDPLIGRENVDRGLANTNAICDLVDNVAMPFQSPKLPTYPLPVEFTSNEQYLRNLCEKGWTNRHYELLPKEDQDIRRKRLDYELAMIHQMGFDGYFLIVWDFINWAKTHGVMVGAGRGSAGGSIVCYLLHISELDPITHDLIFERFLNPERVSMPDIDLDFDDRDKIVQYLVEKYGEDRVCQVLNFSWITPIVAIKDTARILGIPYAIADSISKKFTYDTFQECLDNNKDLVEKYSMEYPELFLVASKLSGRLRNVSIHAGGVGIVDSKITDYMAMKLGSKSEHVIQVDKKIIEEIGIIKFDILGVSTLSVIKEVMDGVGISPWEIDPNNPVFMHDAEMLKILKNADTNGIFQVESQGMKDLLNRLQPDSIEDISAVLALYRPDSMEFLEEFISNKHNPDQIELWHEDMGDIVKDTYGCVIYQEQLMSIVRKFSGRTMGGADKFRKAIGKKDKELIRTESAKLVDEIIKAGYSEGLAHNISEYLASKGGYMFNRAHSMLYSVMTLQTAYLKAHYPANFFCALLNQNRSDFGTLSKYILDAMNFGVDVIAPSINRSERGFSVRKGRILFGLEAIKGIGVKLVDQIVEGRPFKNFEDFVAHINPSTSQIVALIKSGAIPCTNKRGYLLQYAESLFTKKEYTPVTSLPSARVLLEKYNLEFDKGISKEQKLEVYNKCKKEEFVRQQTDKFNKHMKDFEDKYLGNEHLWEFETLSFFLTNNPFLEAYKYVSPIETIPACGKGVIIGVISDVTKKVDRHGKQFAFLNIYSPSGLVDVTCWHNTFKDYLPLIVKGEQVVLLVTKTEDERFVVDEMKPFGKWLEEKKKIK